MGACLLDRSRYCAISDAIRIRFGKLHDHGRARERRKGNRAAQGHSRFGRSRRHYDRQPSPDRDGQPVAERLFCYSAAELAGRNVRC